MSITLGSPPTVITYLDDWPDAPARVPSPFAVPPHPLAMHAAEHAMATMLPRFEQALAGDGKMFGVLVVRDRAGKLGYLAAFSGMLDGSWHHEGFVGPTFDLAERDRFWPGGEAELAMLDDDLAVLDASIAPLRAALFVIDADHATVLEAMQARHRDNRATRKAARGERGIHQARLDELAQASRADSAERDRFVERHAIARADLATRVAVTDAAIAATEARKADRSRHWLVRIHDTYTLVNARGERRSLASMFPAQPPGGAGDCAAPKLFAHAYREGLAPIAIAEWWAGARPATGDRRAGSYYPACRGKCGPILAHVLDGLDVDPAPVFGADPVAADEPRVVFEDDWLVVVAKPVGLLSIPGRGDALGDCVASRLRARYPDATGPLVVHRLDLETSGLLLAAKDAATHTEMQALFARREITKRYIAILDGIVPPGTDRGTIELALRVDVDDRPRQIHDPVHGKSASTAWQVLERGDTTTRVILVPHTGRTHQLRVHCAHPAGLGIPIAGDRLYGRVADRLKLHAMSLSFVHPHTKRQIDLVLPPPF